MECRQSGCWDAVKREVLLFTEEINEEMCFKPDFKVLRTTKVPENLPCILLFPGFGISGRIS